MILTIPLHSFVDLITNSSSEIFVQADENTIKSVKKLIDNLIKASGSDKTADDLFEIDLGYEVVNNETYDTELVTKERFDEIEEKYNEREDTNEDGEDEPKYSLRYSESGCRNSNIVVRVKDKSNKAAEEAAKTLSDLTGLFQLEAF